MLRRVENSVVAVGVLLTLVAGAVPATATPYGAPSYGAPGVGDPYFPADGNGGYDVSRYDVAVDLDPAHPEAFTGDTVVHAKATQELDRCNLDLEGFTVGSVTVNGVPAAFGRAGAHELVITPKRRIHRGAAFAVRVKYAGKPSGESWHQLNGGGVNVTGEPHSATAWFPLNDHPSDKAALHLTATVPAEWTVIGNGLPGATTSSGGKKTFRWHEDHPMVSYASTIAVDKFTVHTSTLADGTPMINAYGQNTTYLKDSEEQLPEIMAFLTKTFGKYPFSSTGSIVVSPVANAGSLALETQTRPTYDELFFDASAVHELAHQWFGDSVSFKDWRDGCVAECFAQYSYQLWQEYKDGANPDDAYRQTVADRKNDADYWKVHIYDPGADRPLDYALYDRGSLMLHALRRTVGDKVFFGTLKAWTSAHRYGNASWPEFEQLAAKQSGKNLTGFFQAWAHSSTIPADQYLYPGPLAS